MTFHHGELITISNEVIQNLRDLKWDWDIYKEIQLGTQLSYFSVYITVDKPKVDPYVEHRKVEETPEFKQWGKDQHSAWVDSVMKDETRIRDAEWGARQNRKRWAAHQRALGLTPRKDPRMEGLCDPDMFDPRRR